MADRWYREAGGNSRPTVQGQQQWVESEIRKLWMKLREPKPIDTSPKEITWSYSDVVNPFFDIDGQAWPAIANINIGSVIVTLQQPSSSSYSLEVQSDFGYLGIVTIPAGSDFSSLGVNLFVPVGRKVWPRLKANSAGDGQTMGIMFRYLFASV